MDNLEFMEEVERSYKRSIEVLLEKEKEYSKEGNRLSQFHEVSALTNSNPVEALIGMAVKHFTSIATMATHPYNYSLKEWRGKTVDLRNYSFLLDALLKDIEVG